MAIMKRNPVPRRVGGLDLAKAVNANFNRAVRWEELVMEVNS